MEMTSRSSVNVRLCLLMMIVAQQLTGGDAGGDQMRRQAAAVYVLGDSTLDVGNNNYLPGKDVFRANKPYNGIDYPGSIPTGRFSNGYNVADFIAMKLGFRESPPPYLSLLQGPSARNLTLAVTALTKGVSFASGGAGILDTTYAGKCIPLSTQLRSMEATRAAMVAKAGTAAVAKHLAHSFFLIGIGSNDMFVFAAALAQQNRTAASPAEVAAFYASLAATYSAAITDLYAMGARNFAVINVGLVGCVPYVRVLSTPVAGACDGGLNRLAAGFDDALATLLADLAGKLPGFAYSVADSHLLGEIAFAADPAASGYTNVDAACCGVGRLNAEGDCQVGATLCPDRDKWAFWDRAHPSQRANKVAAEAYFDGPAQLTKPINFRQLTKAAAMVLKSSGRSVVRLLCLTTIIFQVQLSGGQLQERQVAAVYVLGDSTVDVGNNNYLQNAFKGNIPYYGIDHPGKPAGRYSNGYNVADFIAIKLGFKESPPPYLSLVLLQGPDDPNVQILAATALTKGVNFASGSAGILDFINFGRTLPLSTQLRLMETTKAAMVANAGAGAVAAHLAQSIFLLSIGNNDIGGYTAWLTRHNLTGAAATQPEVIAAFYADLITTYAAAITYLHGTIGARKFAVINAAQVGCVPVARVLSTPVAGACNGSINGLAAGFNDALTALLVDLAGKLPGFAYSLADSYLLGEVEFSDPIASGYTSVEAACCGFGKLNAEGDCQVGATLCPDRDKWVFWDRFHLSQKPCMVSAEAYYDGPAQFTRPINFSQLARITIASTMDMKSSSSSSSSVVHLLCLTMMLPIIFQLRLSSGQLQERQVPAMYVLGDSTLDVGNNNYVPGQDLFRANMPYYGIDHPGKPTGRYSNGYIIADFIAMKLGFRESPQPYLSLLQAGPTPNLTLAVTALTTGISFASGGAGILDLTNLGKSIPLSTQLRFMDATRAAMVSNVGAGAVAAHLARSFFLIGIGNNDMFGFAAVLASQNRTAAATPPEVAAAFYATLLTTYSAAITDLYAIGARKFAVINAGLVGCVPSARVRSTPLGACDGGLNALAAGFNDALATLLVDLAGKLPGFAYSLADSYLLGEIEFSDPIASGYTSVDAACCGVGRLNADGDCQVGAMVCPDRDKWVFWDRFHLSQKPNMISAESYYDGPAHGRSVVRLLCLTMMLPIIFQVQLSSGQQRQVAAVYVLGDSTVDVGNNNYLQNAFKGNMPYYGIDYPGSIPTGRYSNGYNVADFIAMKLGFRESPPPYLSLVLLQEPDDPNLQFLAVTALTKGVNFASGGAGILDFINKGRTLQLSTQLRFMETTKAAMVAKVGAVAVAAHLAQSIFLLSIGNNDIISGLDTWLALHNRTAATPPDVAAFYAELITTYSAAITHLHGIGARKFAVINVGLFGCAPSSRVRSNPVGSCDGGLNRLAAGFNDALATLLVNLAGKLPGFAYSLADSYLLGEIAFTDPIASGYTSVDAACCGVGKLNAEGDCQVGAMLCPDRDRWVFWDSFHLSQKPNMISAEAYYDGPAQERESTYYKRLDMVSLEKRSVMAVSLIAMICTQMVLGAVAGVEPSKIIRQVPAVYVFGDSTLDVGNNNYLPGKDVPKANKPYYGIDFPGSKPTGRFSNGYNAADFVGAGILDSTNAGGNIPLSKQVIYFNSTKAEMVSKVGPGRVRELLAKSFFLFGVGSNDMFAFARAQQKQNRSATPAEVKAFYTSLISNYSAAITELYGMGARKMGIINVGPVGCVPSVRVSNATGGCNVGLNQLAAGFDAALATLMSGLAARLPGLAYSIADSFALTQITFSNPAAAGYANADSACCGAGRLGAEGACQRGASLCVDRDRFVFWDSVHPSQQSNKLGAKAYFDGPAQFTSPISFKQLASYKSS
uniref:GDSL esterase/lipase n=1 Tax=Leersia perrieri TaxID=77586 RepID=A0A0D9WU98_9ORYZ